MLEFCHGELDASTLTLLSSEIGDRDVDIQPWSPAPSSQFNEHSKCQLRTVVTKHPVKTRMPGIPSHVKSTKIQTLSEGEAGLGGKKSLPVIKVHETNVVEGVPFSDRFFVVLVWTVKWGEDTAGGSGSSSKPPYHSERRNSKADGSKAIVRLTVHQHIVFRRPFWLERVVEKETASETLSTLKLWSLLAHQKVAVPVDGKSPAPTPMRKEGGTTTGFKCRLLSVARHLLLTGLLTSLVVLVTKGASYVPELVHRSRQTKSK